MDLQCPNSIAERAYDGGGPVDETYDKRVSEYRFLLPTCIEEMQRLCRQSIDEGIFPLFVSLGLNLPHLAAETISKYVADYIDKRCTELADEDRGYVDIEGSYTRVTYFAQEVEKFILSETLKSSALNDEETAQVVLLSARMRFSELHVENVGFTASRHYKKFMPQIFSVAVARPAIAANLLERVGRALFEIEAQQLLKFYGSHDAVHALDADFNHLRQKIELERLLA